MGKLLTAAVSPAKLAAGAQVLEIEEVVSDFSRLRDALVRGLESIETAQWPENWEQARVTGQISFDFADAQSNAAAAEVAASVRVPLVCQRCLDAFSEDLSVATRLVFDSDAEAPERDGFESWELEGDSVRPLDLVDELLVMALPFAALHDDADCHRAAAATGTVADAPLRPFADLRAQMEAASKPEKPGKE